MISTWAPLPTTSLNAARLNLTAEIPEPTDQAPSAGRLLQQQLVQLRAVFFLHGLPLSLPPYRV